jgi:hypothetical protein
MRNLIEGPFARLFPSRMEPVEIARKLEYEMEGNVRLHGDGRRLAPNVYDVYLSIKDHQQMTSIQGISITDWQKRLIEFARHRSYTLRTVPVIRLHGDPNLRPGNIRVETTFDDGQSGDGAMATQAISAEQLAQLRAQLSSNTGAQRVASSQIPVAPPQPVLPHAQLVIRLPQGSQQTYRIEKPVINIGRQLNNDIIVEDKRVSRQHAQLKYMPDGTFAIFDLGSTNGITINNIPNMRQQVLRNGDRFTIGNYDFFFERR